MTTPRAADLPVGSVVEFAKRLDTELLTVRRVSRTNDVTWAMLADTADWDGPLGWRGFRDVEVQWQLDNGAQVLRVGDGRGRDG